MPESRHRRRRGRALPRTARSAGSLTTTRPKRKRTNKFYLVASVLVAVLVIAGFAAGSLGRGGPSSSALQTGTNDQFVQGIGVPHPVMPGTYPDPHVPQGDTVSYSTIPPTSGKHWGRWAECGFYTEGLADERITHNLEHGNIVVSYNLTTPEEVDQLRTAVEGIDLYDEWGLTRFYSEIPEGTVALATWGALDTIEGIDRERMNQFFSAYAGTLGPEQIPCGFSNLGTG